jgi:hypothetical protein
MAGVAASAWTLVEEKIGTNTAVWTAVIQGHSQNRLRPGDRQRGGSVGPDVVCGESAQPLDALGRGRKIRSGVSFSFCVVFCKLGTALLAGRGPLSVWAKDGRAVHSEAP